MNYAKLDTRLKNYYFCREWVLLVPDFFVQNSNASHFH